MIFPYGDDYTQSEVYHSSGPSHLLRAASLHPQVLYALHPAVKHSPL